MGSQGTGFDHRTELIEAHQPTCQMGESFVQTERMQCLKDFYFSLVMINDYIYIYIYLIYLLIIIHGFSENGVCHKIENMMADHWIWGYPFSKAKLDSSTPCPESQLK
jgi:hypothetical protein